MLYIVSTPIGNLGDITLRALDVLKRADFILCEDTRKSSILLNHYQIKKKLISFHKFSEKSKEDFIISQLHEGKEICLISDGGTPLICDPGQSLIQRCILEELKISEVDGQSKKTLFTAIPGPCSLINALLLSGFSSETFQFLGFLPKSPNKVTKVLTKIFSYEGTSIVFESPFRVIKTLTKVEELYPTMQVAIVREMTKKFEEIFIGDAETIKKKLLQKSSIKGEFVLLFSH